MGSPQSELTLDFKPPSDKSLHLQEFLARLEEERLKIEAFKRELPLCMKLLTNAMETYKQQLETYQTNNGAKSVVLEEYIPLKSMTIHGSSDQEKTTMISTASTEKSSWMVSAQLWSPATSDEPKQQHDHHHHHHHHHSNQNLEVSTSLALDTKQRNGTTGAFIPFTKDNNTKIKVISNTSTTSTTNSISSYPVSDLALACHNKEIENKNLSEVENGPKSAPTTTTTTTTDGQSSVGTSQTQRKARRCWSPDLHRRFVNALQILGGSQVATPKQIRELMKVDGLTNDEVKSHLQKYRLHTRRPMMAAQQAAAAAAPQLVVLGGIWVPPEYTTSAVAGPGIYGAHPVPTHYCAAPPVAQEFYSPATAAVAAAHQHHQHLSHVQSLQPRNVGSSYKGRVQSPESDMRSGGERSGSTREEEDDDDEKEGREDEDEEEDADVEGDDKSATENALVLVSHGFQETSGLKL